MSVKSTFWNDEVLNGYQWSVTNLHPAIAGLLFLLPEGYDGITWSVERQEQWIDIFRRVSQMCHGEVEASKDWISQIQDRLKEVEEETVKWRDAFTHADALLQSIRDATQESGPDGQTPTETPCDAPQASVAASTLRIEGRIEDGQEAYDTRGLIGYPPVASPKRTGLSGFKPKREALKTQLESAGGNAQALSKALGFSRAYFTTLTGGFGNASEERARKIAAYFGLPVSDLFETPDGWEEAVVDSTAQSQTPEPKDGFEIEEAIVENLVVDPVEREARAYVLQQIQVRPPYTDEKRQWRSDVKAALMEQTGWDANTCGVFITRVERNGNA